MMKFPTKQCSKCKEEKILHEFGKCHGYEKYTSACKACIKKYKKPTEGQIITKNLPEHKSNFGDRFF